MVACLTEYTAAVSAIATSHQSENWKKSSVGLTGRPLYCCMVWEEELLYRFKIISPCKWEVKTLSASLHLKNVVSHQFLIVVCVCASVFLCEVAAHREWAEQHFFTGPLAAEGPKPQALPRPTLLCNSRPKAIMHGACQTGLALSHNHTCIQALYHIYEHSLGALQLAGMGGNLNEHFNQNCCYDCASDGWFPASVATGTNSLFWGQSA